MWIFIHIHFLLVVFYNMLNLSENEIENIISHFQKSESIIEYKIKQYIT